MSNSAIQAAIAAKKAEAEKQEGEAKTEVKVEASEESKQETTEQRPQSLTPNSEYQPEFEEVSENVEVFQFPITPCTYKFRGRRDRTPCPDGTIRTSNPTEIKELEEKAKRGLCKKITGLEKAPINQYQKPVKPGAQIQDEGDK